MPLQTNANPAAVAAAGLVDTYALVVSPVVLGKGRALFEGVPSARLALAGSRAFPSGNVLMVYHPA